tara:strand:- start:4724 stop:5350 length:627 start_codon:yes stop_codon:yes gene_type:complete
MIEFTNDQIKYAQSNSLVLTYPRKVQVTCGTYPVIEDIHNFKIFIKNNIDENESYGSNVKSTKTSWKFFRDHPLFLKFLNHLINLHQTTNSDVFEYFYERHYIRDAWGIMMKKGDYVDKHCHPQNHGILYLTDGGSPLIVPELGIKITPKAGDYYVFPPFIYHYVPAHTEDTPRFNVVFNLDEKLDWDKQKRLHIKQLEDEKNATKDS